ncbi:MAG TPA: TPM domain-containing protein [Cytophagales bacterium]
MLLAAPGFAEIPVPKLMGRVNDYAGILSPAAEASLERELKAHEDSTTNQIVVLTVASLEGENLEEAANRVFNAWGLGQRGKDNGVLLLVAVNDRKLRIEVGNGLEGVLTDVHCGRIIRNEITPSFKYKEYEAGIAAGVAAIRGAIYGTYAAQDPDYWEQLLTYEGLGFPDFILPGIFVMALLLVFTAVAYSGNGPFNYFMFFFIAFFYLSFPFAIFGSFMGFVILAAYTGGFIYSRFWLRSPAGKAHAARFAFKGGGSGSSRRSYSSSRSSSSFSGGGGRSSGGGSSGSW